MKKDNIFSCNKLVFDPKPFYEMFQSISCINKAENNKKRFEEYEMSDICSSLSRGSLRSLGTKSEVSFTVVQKVSTMNLLFIQLQRKLN